MKTILDKSKSKSPGSNPIMINGTVYENSGEFTTVFGISAIIIAVILLYSGLIGIGFILGPIGIFLIIVGIWSNKKYKKESE